MTLYIYIFIMLTNLLSIYPIYPQRIFYLRCSKVLQMGGEIFFLNLKIYYELDGCLHPDLDKGVHVECSTHCYRHT